MCNCEIFLKYENGNLRRPVNILPTKTIINWTRREKLEYKVENELETGIIWDFFRKLDRFNPYVTIRYVVDPS